MLAYIKDNKYIHLDQVTQGSEESIVAWFSVRHPKAYYIDTEASWDGWYRRYSVKTQRLALPLLQELKECCKANDIPLEIKDQRGAPKFPAPKEEHITTEFIEGIALDPHQLRGLQIACDKEIGIYDMKTGAGKTEIMCGLIKMFRCPTLVITEQIVVLEQIVNRLKVRNVVHNDDIGMFCYGYMPDNNLVMVGSIQSLSTPPPPPKEPKQLPKGRAFKVAKEWAEKEKLREFFPEPLWKALEERPAAVKKLTGKYLKRLIALVSKDAWLQQKRYYKVRLKNSRHIQKMVSGCDLLLVDEADKATSDNYKPLFRRIFKGRRRYGFTGTPFDKNKPVQNLFLKDRLGSVICKARRRELEEIGRIIPIEYIMVACGEDGNKADPTAFDIAEREFIIENTDFHSLILRIVTGFPDDSTLILVDTSAIEELGFMLEELIPNSKFIYGKTTKPQRRKYIKLFEEKELSCLIGGKILKRGLDLQGGCDNLILVGGGKLESDFDQKIGRAVRNNRRGKSRVFDFLFLNNKYLYAHSRARLKAVVGMGYKSKVIISGREIDGGQVVRSRFRIPNTR